MANVKGELLQRVKEVAKQYAPLYGAYAVAFNKLYHFQSELEILKDEIESEKKEALANLSEDDPEYDEIVDAYNDLSEVYFRDETGKTIEDAIALTEEGEDY